MPNSATKNGVVFFNQFCLSCRYFNPYAEIDNGHGCWHEGQQDIYFNDEGSPEGACRCGSCPLGRVADADDVDEIDTDWSYVDAETVSLDDLLVIPTSDIEWERYVEETKFFRGLRATGIIPKKDSIQ